MPTLLHIPRPLAGALAVAVLAAAGCGSSASKNDYVKSLNKAEAKLQQSLAAIGNGAGSGSQAARLEKSGDAIDAAAADFAAIDPPADAKQAHGEIVDGVRKLAGNVHDAAKATGSGDKAAIAKALQGLQQSAGLQEIQKAQDELVAAGYKVAGS